MVQWLRIRLPMQGTWVWVLVQEDPTCRGATKPVCHNYWACALQPVSHNYWAHALQLLKPACSRARMLQLLKSVRLESCSATRGDTAMRNLRTTTNSSPRSPQLEKAHAQQQRPSAAKKQTNKQNWKVGAQCMLEHWVDDWMNSNSVYTCKFLNKIYRHVG